MTKREWQAAKCAAKKKFATEGTAILFGAHVVGNPKWKKERRSVRSYRCPIYHFWHLTSRVSR